MGTISPRKTALRSGPRAWIVVAAATLIAAFAAGCSSSPSTPSGPKTLEVWLSGDLTQATPGSPYRLWMNHVIKRFEAANPGWKVSLSLLSYDPAQESAKLIAAFGSNTAPQVLNLYTGQFTNTFANYLLPLNKDVLGTPGLYSSIPASIWNLDCTHYNCAGGQNPILGVPWNGGTYFLFYNKALLAKAGIKGPPATYNQLFADCKLLSAKGVTAYAMGANDGYDTSNYWTTNLGSWLAPGDIQKVLNGTMAYNAPPLVNALEPILKITSPSSKCTSPNALGEGQVQGTTDFQAGKAAMTGFYSLSLVPFEKALGSKLGVARLPLSGSGPLLHVNDGYPGNPWDGWVINKNVSDPKVAWSFVKIASDQQSNETAASMMGFSPAFTSASATLTDPLAKIAAQLAASPSIPELDMVMPDAYALNLYRQLALGQEQKQSAAQTLAAVEAYAKANPKPGA